MIANIDRDNPFVSISTRWKIALVLYAVFWRILPEILSPVLHGNDHGHGLTLALTAFTLEVLLLIPILVHRLGGLPAGWLNPLVFPTVFLWGTSVVRSPFSLLDPIIVWSSPISDPFFNQYLSGMPNDRFAFIMIKRDILTILSIVSLYFGYHFFRFRAPALVSKKPKNLTLVMAFISVIIITVLFVLLQSNGGLISHMTALGLGRARAIGDDGHLAIIVRLGPILLVLWYVLDKNVVKNPIFLILAAFILVSQFVATGSRSSMIVPILYLMAVWIFHTRRIPAVRVVIFTIIAFLALGVLGEVRRSSRSNDTVTFDAITEFKLRESANTTLEELDSRSSKSSALPLFYKVPDEVPLLWGETYMNAVTFFIPKMMWPERPRAIGVQAHAKIIEGLETMEGYSGPGNPPGPVAEAYWNFHIPGVVIVFVFFGILKRWIATIFLQNLGNPAVAAFYFFTLFYMTAPTSVVLNRYFKYSVLVFAIFFALGFFRKIRRKGTGRFGSVHAVRSAGNQ